LKRAVISPNAVASTGYNATKIAETAIVVDGNTSASRIAKNAYVILRNSTIEGKADGFYKSGATIEAGSTIPANALSEKTIGSELKTVLDNIGTLSNLTTTDKTNLVAAINEAIANNEVNTSGANQFFYSVYPNGHGWGTQPISITVPFPVAHNKTVTFTLVDAYVYDASGNFTDITSSCSLGEIGNFGVRLQIAFNSSHVNKMLRVQFTVTCS